MRAREWNSFLYPFFDLLLIHQKGPPNPLTVSCYSCCCEIYLRILKDHMFLATLCCGTGPATLPSWLSLPSCIWSLQFKETCLTGGCPEHPQGLLSEITNSPCSAELGGKKKKEKKWKHFPSVLNRKGMSNYIHSMLKNLLQGIMQKSGKAVRRLGSLKRQHKS